MNAINSPVTTAMGGEPLFTAAEVGARYGWKPTSMANMRCGGRGPRWRRLPNGQVRYALSDLLAWELGNWAKAA